MVPPPRKSGSKKIFIALGGVVALLFLVVAGVGGIIGYNYWIKPTPTPAWTPTPAATPTATPTPSKSATATPKPIDTPRPSDLSNVKVKFSKVWVDYNVTKDGEMGMRVHVKFDVSNMKGVDSNVIIYFQKEDNSFILGGVGNYRGKDGRIAVFQPIRPAYDNTVYTDLEIFVPYSELNQSLSKGKYNLKMDIDLTDDDENQIEHLTLHDFKYEKF